jgi:hypothetical protein
MKPAPILRPLACVVASLAFAALASLACGSPLVGAECEPPGCGEAACQVNADCQVGELCQGGACVAKPECATNADCTGDRICKAGACKDVLGCVIDAHCPCDKGTCKDNVCVGPAKACTAQPVPCAINADCPAKTYCVGQQCLSTLECRKHADCPAGEACYEQLCFPL